jgi:TolB-like protein
MKKTYQNSQKSGDRRQMTGDRGQKTKSLASDFWLLTSVLCILLTAGCAKQVIIVTDARYYEGKIKALTDQLVKSVTKEKLAVAGADKINRVAVMDFINFNGKVSTLGKYLSSKLSETIIEKNYFKVVQRGEVLGVLKVNNIVSTGGLNNETMKRLGEGLNADAFFFGEIIDLGTNIDINVKFISSKNGEILSAASFNIDRTRSAINLMETF